MSLAFHPFCGGDRVKSFSTARIIHQRLFSQTAPDWNGRSHSPPAGLSRRAPERRQGRCPLTLRSPLDVPRRRRDPATLPASFGSGIIITYAPTPEIIRHHGLPVVELHA